MLRLVKAFERTFAILGKLCFMLALFIIFYSIFYALYEEVSPELQRISRVSAVVTITYFVVQYAMIRIYGGFSIGTKRTKEIVLGMVMAVAVTDAVAYAMLCIMEKTIKDFDLLLPVLAVQIVFIVLFTKICNNVYDVLHKPKKLLLIHGDESKLRMMLWKLKKEQNRFFVGRIMRYDEEELHRSIRASEAVMLVDVPDDKKRYIIEYCYKRSKQIYFLPSLSDILVHNARHDLLEDTSMFSYEHIGLTYEQKILKRLCDIVLSGIGILITSPVMIITALAVRLSDKGPAIYKQERATEGGRLFNVYKFRTMVVNAEQKNKAVLAANNDPRITKVGSFLRKTRIDELPQLFNIFFGHMSVVGPRPERESIALAYYKDLPEFKYRLKVKAGLTGLAQIMGKYNTTPKDKLVLDLLYIESYSIKLDLKIIFQTLVVCLTPERTEGFAEGEKVTFERDATEQK